VSYIRESLGLSERKSCLLVNISVSAYRYRPREDNDEALRHRLRELAGQRKRFGSHRLHIMLKRENLVVNHKRTERIYREEGLALRRKRRRKGAAGIRVIIPAELEKELLDEYGNFAANDAGYAFEYTEQDIYEQLRKKLRPYEKNR
jgi:hypothetical protein